MPTTRENENAPAALERDEGTDTHLAAGVDTTVPGRHVNAIRTSTGKLRAVCEFCGRTSRAVTPDPYTGRISLWDLSTGWSEAPYPVDFVHVDGSTGSQYSCPPCNRRLRNGEGLRMHGEPRVGAR